MGIDSTNIPMGWDLSTLITIPDNEKNMVSLGVDDDLIDVLETVDGFTVKQSE